MCCVTEGMSCFLPLFFLPTSQLCNGGSVTELVKGLLKCGQQLDEAMISYILYGALLVRLFTGLVMTAEGAICSSHAYIFHLQRMIMLTILSGLLLQQGLYQACNPVDRCFYRLCADCLHYIP